MSCVPGRMPIVADSVCFCFVCLRFYGGSVKKMKMGLCLAPTWDWRAKMMMIGGDDDDPLMCEMETD